jgi:predicted aspartyl protease
MSEEKFQVTAGLLALLLILSPAAGAADTNSDALMQLVNARKFLELEQALQKPDKLSIANQDFFQGVLANRKNEIAASMRLLARVLDSKSPELSAEQRRIGLLSLADDYAKSFQYGKAADTDALVLRELGANLDEKTRTQITADKRSYSLARRFFVQTVKADEPFTISTTHNAIGLTEVAVETHGETKSWILDTGAGLTTLSTTYAKHLGLRLSEGTVPVSGASGAVSQGYLAVIPELRLGQAEFHNVVALVIEDKNLYVPELKLQLDAVLGSPVLTALGRLTFYADGRLECGGGAASDSGAEMFMDDLPLVAIGTPAGIRLFVLDTGGNTTLLLSPYWEENHVALGDPPLHPGTVAGIGGNSNIPAADLKNVPLFFGTVPMTMKEMAVFSQPRSAEGEYFYGYISQDLLRTLRSYTIDYRAMRFRIEAQ